MRCPEPGKRGRCETIATVRGTVLPLRTCSGPSLCLDAEVEARVAGSMRPQSGWRGWRALLPFGGRIPTSDVQDTLALQQLDGVMGDAVHRLSEEHQRLLALRFAHGYTVAQVARATSRPKAEVRMSQLRALRALQHELESHAS
jgi:hypothetical protein